MSPYMYVHQLYILNNYEPKFINKMKNDKHF